MRRNKLILITALLFTQFPYARGNDSAASTALGGIQLRREPRISMLKERLTISTQKVTVEYEFLNESDSDITTEIAFPIPPYSIDPSAAGTRGFDDFRVWVEGVPVAYETQAKARIYAKDYSMLLQKYGVDIGSLGHFQDQQVPFSADFRKLSPAAQEELTKAELFDADEHLPQWTVEKTYHWQQTFPAHKPLHVRHEYKPGVGFTPVETKFFDSTERKRQVAQDIKEGRTEIGNWLDEASQIDNACVDPGLEKLLVAANQIDPGPHGSYDKGYVRMVWVDYILTTANNWKTPIKDFELVVEKPIVEGGLWYVSFCWDGPVKRIDASRFRARVRNFVPEKELHIAFFRVH